MKVTPSKRVDKVTFKTKSDMQTMVMSPWWLEDKPDKAAAMMLGSAAYLKESLAIGIVTQQHTQGCMEIKVYILSLGPILVRWIKITGSHKNARRSILFRAWSTRWSVGLRKVVLPQSFLQTMATTNKEPYRRN